MKTIGNEPAMPTLEWGHKGYGEYGWITINGLTKREHLAALAMQGMLTQRSTLIQEFNDAIIPIYAEKSVKMADALIKALNKESETNHE